MAQRQLIEEGSLGGPAMVAARERIAQRRAGESGDRSGGVAVAKQPPTRKSQEVTPPLPKPVVKRTQVTGWAHNATQPTPPEASIPPKAGRATHSQEPAVAQPEPIAVQQPHPALTPDFVLPALDNLPGLSIKPGSTNDNAYIDSIKNELDAFYDRTRRPSLARWVTKRVKGSLGYALIQKGRKKVKEIRKAIKEDADADSPTGVAEIRWHPLTMRGLNLGRERHPIHDNYLRTGGFREEFPSPQPKLDPRVAKILQQRQPRDWGKIREEWADRVKALPQYMRERPEAIFRGLRAKFAPEVVKAYSDFPYSPPALPLAERRRALRDVSNNLLLSSVSPEHIATLLHKAGASPDFAFAAMHQVFTIQRNDVLRQRQAAEMRLRSFQKQLTALQQLESRFAHDPQEYRHQLDIHGRAIADVMRQIDEIQGPVDYYNHELRALAYGHNNFMGRRMPYPQRPK